MSGELGPLSAQPVAGFQVNVLPAYRILRLVRRVRDKRGHSPRKGAWRPVSALRALAALQDGVGVADQHVKAHEFLLRVGDLQPVLSGLDEGVRELPLFGLLFGARCRHHPDPFIFSGEVLVARHASGNRECLEALPARHSRRL